MICCNKQLNYMCEGCKHKWYVRARQIFFLQLVSRLHSWGSDHPGQAEHAETDSEIILQAQVMNQIAISSISCTFLLQLQPLLWWLLILPRPPKGQILTPFSPIWPTTNIRKPPCHHIYYIISMFKHGLNSQSRKSIFPAANPLLWLLQLPLWPDQIAHMATTLMARPNSPQWLMQVPLCLHYR